MPLPFVLGLLVLLLARVEGEVLPGAGSLAAAIGSLPVLLLPALLTNAGAQLAASRLRRQKAPPRMARALLQLAAGLVPLVQLVVLIPGTWLDLALTFGGSSQLARTGLLLLPLLVTELLRIGAERRTMLLLDGTDFPPGPLPRHRAAFVLVLTIPWLLLALGIDVLAMHRWLYVHAMATSLGTTLGGIGFLVLLGVLLPLAFRALFGFARELPPAIADELRATAAALGFPGRAVMRFDSGMRMVNALMLGPMPWPRYLVLTDGLLATLDVHALRGVVAHEVGHAQAGHPLLLMALFVVVPLLAGNVLLHFDFAAIDPIVLVVGGFAVLLGAILVLRRIAHRFEHEADVLSAIALGGAEPCIRALQRVGAILQQDVERSSLLHPSEGARVRLLLQFAVDAGARARFALRGLHLRRAIVAAMGLAGIAAGWSWFQVWPMERAVVQYLLGDFRGAREQVERVGAGVPAHQWQWWQDFRLELDAASAVLADGGPWDSIREQLAAAGWRRGIEVLLQQGPAAARPWFSLATASAAYDGLREAVLAYCTAAAANDHGRMAVLRRHIAHLDVPPDLAVVFRE